MTEGRTGCGIDRGVRLLTISSCRFARARVGRDPVGLACMRTLASTRAPAAVCASLGLLFLYLTGP
jgi:hypothetical protein